MQRSLLLFDQPFILEGMLLQHLLSGNSPRVPDLVHGKDPWIQGLGPIANRQQQMAHPERQGFPDGRPLEQFELGISTLLATPFPLSLWFAAGIPHRPSARLLDGLRPTAQCLLQAGDEPLHGRVFRAQLFQTAGRHVDRRVVHAEILREAVRVARLSLS